MKIKLGQIVTPPPASECLNWGSGVVVSIHPKKRFYTVEFHRGEVKFRESYSFWTPQQTSTDSPKCQLRGNS